MDIKRLGSSEPTAGPSDYFTGKVHIQSVIDAPAPSRVRAALVSFEGGARTGWHTHPLGQTLVVTSGSGLVQVWGGSIKEINEGDTVWFAPGEKHWHGASPRSAMTHLAIHEALDGKTVDWLEQVSQDDYEKR